MGTPVHQKLGCTQRDTSQRATKQKKISEDCWEDCWRNRRLQVLSEGRRIAAVWKIKEQNTTQHAWPSCLPFYLDSFLKIFLFSISENYFFLFQIVLYAFLNLKYESGNRAKHASWPWCLAFYLQSVDMECAHFNIQQNAFQIAGPTNIQQNVSRIAGPKNIHQNVSQYGRKTVQF